MQGKLSLLAVPVAALAIAACGSSNSSSSSSAASSSASPAATSSSSAPATTSSAATSSSSSAASSGGAAAGASTTLSLSAKKSGALAYNTKKLTAKAGKVTIKFTNDSPLPHNVTIQSGTSGPTIGATPTFRGGTRTLTVRLKAGTYTYYCSVPGHRQAGMLGTLTVTG